MMLASLSLTTTMLLASVPDVVLNNSAVKGLRMPALGLGTGAYANFDNSSVECWAGDVNQKCAARAHDSIVKWIKLGGKRLDCANAYYNQKVVGKAWKASGAKREDLFLLTKVGPSLPLGYQDTKDQFKQILADLQTDYVDAVLIHWPFLNPKHNDPPKGVNVTVSSDPACINASPTFNGTKCRLDTWKALVEIFQEGGAKSIGTSNYYEADIQEIIDAKMPLPALIQNPYHIYRSSSQSGIKKFIEEHGILFVSNSPFAAADWYHPPPDVGPTPLKNPVVQNIAEAHNVTAAQVMIQWQWALGIPSNPRTSKEEHMLENLGSFNFALTNTELETLSNFTQVLCTEDPNYYDCAPARRQVLPQ